MSGFRIDINDTQVRAALRRLQRHAESEMRQTLDAVGTTLTGYVADSFELGEDPWGETWESLADSTIRARRKGDGEGEDKPLINTGNLLGSLTHNATAKVLEVGVTAAYGAYHQFGTKHVPQRAFLPVHENGADIPGDWADDVENIVLTLLRRSMQ